MQTLKSLHQSRLVCRFRASFGALILACAVLVPLTVVEPVVAQRAVDFDIDDEFRKARKMYQRGDLDGSEKIFKRILQIQPSHTASRDYLFRIKEQRENVPQVTLAHHLSSVKLKEVKMENFALSDAVKYLRVKVPDLLKESGKEDVNVNFVVFNSGGQADKLIPTDLVLTNIPVSEFIRYVCDLAGYKATYRGEMVEFRPVKE